MARKSTEELEFVRRGQRKDCETAERMVYRSACNRYRVARYKSLYERDKRGCPLTWWRAEVWWRADAQYNNVGSWCTVGPRVKSRESAERLCRKDARKT